MIFLSYFLFICHVNSAQVKFHPNKSDWLATGSTDGLVCVFDISQSSEEDALVTTLNSESSVVSMWIYLKKCVVICVQTW